MNAKRLPGDRTRGRMLHGVHNSLVVLFCIGVAGCDDLLTVENPQDILDENLESPEAINALSAGVAGDFAFAYGRNLLMTGILSDEIKHTGSQSGLRQPDEGDGGSAINTWTNNAYNAVAVSSWTGEDLVRRIERVTEGADSNPHVAHGKIFAGFSILILADNYCEVIIDGGPRITPAEAYAEAAIRFTDALAVATAAGDPDLVNRALAGRARARLQMQDYEGARDDARQIPTGFRFLALYSPNSGREENHLANQMTSSIRREAGVHARYYEHPVLGSDPRIAFTNRGETYVGTDGSTQFVEQLKFQTTDDDIEVASWQEARLIEAEAAIHLNDLSGAIALIDEVRVAAGLPPYDGPVTAEAVTNTLFHERAAELFLEGQRLLDLRRTNDPWLQDRDSCYQIGRAEG